MHHNTRTNGLGDAGCVWPVEKKGLDALDRELALLISVKRWVAGATGGITPRSLEKDYPCNDTKSYQKHVDYVFQQRCEKVENSCRNLGLRMRACRDGLIRDLKSLEQSHIDESNGRFAAVRARARKPKLLSVEIEQPATLIRLASSEGPGMKKEKLFCSKLPSPKIGISKSLHHLDRKEALKLPKPKNSKQLRLANIKFDEMMNTTSKFFQTANMPEKERMKLLYHTSKQTAAAWTDAALHSSCDLGLSASLLPPFRQGSMMKTSQHFIGKRRQLAEEEYMSQVKSLISELRPEMDTVRTLNIRLGSKWAMLIKVANSFLPFRKRFARHIWEKEVYHAAVKIQTYIRGKQARKTVQALRQLGPALKRTIWRYSLKLRCSRRARQANLLRRFTNDYATRWVQQMVYNFRRCVVKCQRIIRQWLDCKRNRIYALSLIWDRVEKKEENQKLLRHMAVLSDTTDLDRDGDGSISSAEIQAAARDERGAEKNWLFVAAKAFDSSYTKASRIIVKSNMARMKNDSKMAEIERLGRWNKWRGGFARCCKTEFVKTILEPYLKIKRHEHMVYSHEVRSRLVRGASRKDMQSFVHGESFGDLMSRMKPQSPPLLLYSTLTEQKMLDFVMSGCLMQIKFDKDLERRKLEMWDEIDAMAPAGEEKYNSTVAGEEMDHKVRVGSDVRVDNTLRISNNDIEENKMGKFMMKGYFQ
jgi:hypothetical protein